MQLIEVTYLCCKFGIEYAFKQRDKIIRKFWSVQNMDTFHANIVTILWEEKVQTFRFAVRLYVYIEMFIQKDCQGTVSSGNSETNSGNNHSLAIPSQGGMHSFNR
jgi:hypothetical protein